MGRIYLHFILFQPEFELLLIVSILLKILQVFAIQIFPAIVAKPHILLLFVEKEYLLINWLLTLIY